ncbi:hypothetical protein EYV94_13845 [Puteibacter caeruleilacunae]|nr:hypothetical protein EYV94_13845 [Puteibacter caeruleilacunae]
MKNLFAIVCIFLWFMPVVAQNNPVQIRIMTFNLYHCENMDGSYDLDHIAQIIADFDPDVVALQEVDNKTTRSKKIDQIYELGARTYLASLFGKTISFDTGEFGNGILSKYGYKEFKNHRLESIANYETRALLEAKIRTKDGLEFKFLSTHLCHANEENRKKQVRHINDMFGNSELPVILAGDMNALPSSEPINILRDYWKLAFEKDLKNTYPSKDPKGKIDYILFKPKDAWRVIETKVIQDSKASDHLAVCAVVEYIGKK